MNDRALIGFGTAGTIFAAVCCAAPLLVVGLPLAAWARDWWAHVW